MSTSAGMLQSGASIKQFKRNPSK